ncbi:uncharacterized protein LOC126678491 [Mercurialis annua]|uniref:uncharacterized protein LOC126678491 n=1 Tax=Mercurialis annua TaxID=3986 RepID=UPI00215F69C3|nr:uncharacterized protein LOC126678491 [Mercurialis annua]
MEVSTSTKVTWKIDNFSKLTTSYLYSDVFAAERCKWCLRVFPKGNNVDHLSMYLDVPDSVSLPNGWSRNIDLSLSVINQFQKTSTIKKDRQQCVFTATKINWGAETFVPLREINNLAAGYLVNDTLIVEAEIQVRSVVHYSVIEPAMEVNKNEPELPKRAVETPVDQVPLSQKEVHETKATVEPPTAIIIPLTAKSLNQTEGAVQAGASSNEQEIVKESLPPPIIVDHEKDLPRDPPFEPALSSPDVQEISKNLLNEISCRRRTQKSFPSNEIPVSIEATRPDFVSQQKEALLGFFNMSLEAIQQANAFDNIEGIILALVQHANSLQEKTILEDLASRLAEFRESIPNSTTKAETVEARRISLAGKTVDLNARLEQRQKEITALENKFSRLSEEEAKLQAEIQRLMIKKQSTAIELHEANEVAFRDLEEWKGLEGEIKQSNAEWHGAKEKVAFDNVSWKLFKEDLGLGKLNISNTYCYFVGACKSSENMKVSTSTTLTWKIHNFSKLTPSYLYSGIFIAERCKWRLCIYPKGNNVDHLSIYLHVADSISLPNGWSRDVKFSLSIINQLRKKTSFTKDAQHVFHAAESDWGFKYFIPLSKLNDAAASYLVNDTLTVEAEVQVHSVVHYSVIEPAEEINKDERNLPNLAVETPLDQVPLLQKEVHEPKAMVEPPSQTDGVAKESLLPPTIVNKKNVPQDPAPSEPVPSSPDVQKISKNLLTEISSRARTQNLFPSIGIPVSIEASRPDFMNQQKEALLGFFNMSLEAIQQANAFDNIEGIIPALVQHANSLHEKTILEDLASRLAEFRESIANTSTIAETVAARRISLAGKTVDLNGKLEQRQMELSALEDKFSRFSEEQAKLQAEIQCLEMQKKNVVIELQKANEGASRDLEEWRGLEGEIKQSNGEWLGAKEKLALANVRWKLYKEDLGLGKLNIS